MLVYRIYDALNAPPTAHLSVKQSSCRDREGDRELFQHGDRRVARAAFKVADIGTVDAGTVGIFFLAPAFLVTEAAQVCGKALTDIHIAGKPLCGRSIYRRSVTFVLTRYAFYGFVVVTYRLQGATYLMTQFLLLLDDAGAEFIYARSTRKEIVTTGPTGVVRFRPTAIRPIEMLDEKGGCAPRGGRVRAARSARRSTRGPDRQRTDGAVRTRKQRRTAPKGRDPTGQVFEAAKRHRTDADLCLG